MVTTDPSSGPDRAPRTIQPSDVERLEADTRALRVLDHRHSGDACPGAVHSRVGDGRLMLDASAAEGVQRRLHVVLGDLHNLAARRAVPLHTGAIDGYGDGTARSRAFSLILLSVNHLLDRYHHPVPVQAGRRPVARDGV